VSSISGLAAQERPACASALVSSVRPLPRVPHVTRPLLTMQQGGVDTSAALNVLSYRPMLVTWFVPQAGSLPHPRCVVSIMNSAVPSRN
jgi:hypothetical protein